MKRMQSTIRVLLAGLFIAAGVAKLTDLEGFLDAIKRFEVLPEAVLPWLAGYLPWFEIIAGLALLTPQFFRGAWWLLAGFLVLATTMLTQAYFRGLEIDCGCWGVWFEMTIVWAILRNVVLMVLLGLCRRMPT